MNKTKSEFSMFIIGICLLIVAGLIFSPHINSFLKDTYTRANFKPEDGNQLTPEGYAPEVVGIDKPSDDNTTSDKGEQHGI